MPVGSRTVSSTTAASIDDPSASGLGTVVRSINDAGQIVGYFITNPAIIDGRAFLYSGGTYTPLDFPGARDGSATFAFGLNNTGDVVGYYVNSQQDSYGFLYSGGGQRLDAEQTQHLLDRLVKAGWLRRTSTVTGGRKRHRWQVNSKIHAAGTAGTARSA